MQLQKSFALLIDMLQLCFAKNYYIFEVNDEKLPFNDGRDHIYGTLEGAVGIADSRWHSNKTIETMMGCKSSLIFVCIINFVLPIFGFSV